MKQYELNCLFSPDFTDSDVSSLKEKINVYIQNEGGLLGESAIPVKKRLGTAIKKADSAYHCSLVFDLDPEKLPSLRKNLDSEPNILRYMVLNWKPKPIMEERKRFPKVRKIEQDQKQKDGTQDEPHTAESGSTQKAELKELDEKLEEILGE